MNMRDPAPFNQHRVCAKRISAMRCLPAEGASITQLAVAEQCINPHSRANFRTRMRGRALMRIDLPPRALGPALLVSVKWYRLTSAKCYWMLTNVRGAHVFACKCDRMHSDVGGVKQVDAVRSTSVARGSQEGV
jgi:hypothetical protein